MRNIKRMRAFSLMLAVTMLISVIGVLPVTVSASSSTPAPVIVDMSSAATADTRLNMYGSGFNNDFVGQYEFDADEGAISLKYSTGSNGGNGGGRYKMDLRFDSGKAPTSTQTWMVVTYKTNVTSSANLFITDCNGNNVVLETGVAVSGGEWIHTLPVNIGVGDMHGRLTRGTHDLIVVNASETSGVEFYIKEIAFFSSAEEASAYYAEPLIIDMSSQAAAEKTLVFSPSPEGGLTGTNQDWGQSAGYYFFDKDEEALSIKKSATNTAGSPWRFLIKTTKGVKRTDQIALCQKYMVVTYKTNAPSGTGAELQLNRFNAADTDYLTLDADVSRSAGKWVRTEPVNIFNSLSTDTANNLFYRLYNATAHDILIVTLPTTTSDDVYFYVKELAFFESAAEAAEYAADNPLPNGPETAYEAESVDFALSAPETVKTGEEFRVDITATTDSDYIQQLRAFEAELSYDKSKLTFKSMEIAEALRGEHYVTDTSENPRAVIAYADNAATDDELLTVTKGENTVIATATFTAGSEAVDSTAISIVEPFVMLDGDATYNGYTPVLAAGGVNIAVEKSTLDVTFKFILKDGAAEAESYKILASGTKIALIESDVNEKTYSYDEKPFLYSERLGGYVLIVADTLTADDLLDKLTVTDTPATAVNYDGDISGDGSVESGDAALISAMLHNADGAFSDLHRLRADVITKGESYVTTADAMWVLRESVGLNDGTEDDEEEEPVIDGVIIPTTDFATADSKLHIYYTDDVPGGVAHNFGDNAGKYGFDALEQALLIKNSGVHYVGGYYRYHIRLDSTTDITGRPYMVVMYRTNTENAVSMELISNGDTTDRVTVDSDISKSAGEYVFSTPVSLDTKTESGDLHDRLIGGGNHNALTIGLPSSTTADTYFYIKEIAFFPSAEAANEYIANTPLPEANNDTYTSFPLYDLETAMAKLIIYNNSYITNGDSHTFITQFGEGQVGEYRFIENQQALYLIEGAKKANAYQVYFDTRSANMIRSNEQWMVILYRTNCDVPGTVKIYNNSDGNDVVTLVSDYTVSGDKWVYSTPADLDAYKDGTVPNMFARVKNSTQSPIIVDLPLATESEYSAEDYFFIKEILFFSSKEAAERYIAAAPDIAETEPDFGTGLPEDEWVDPSAVSFASELATEANVTVTNGTLSYSNGSASLAGNSVTFNYNSIGYVSDELTFASLSFTDGGSGKFTLSDGTNSVVLDGDTSASAGEWSNSTPVELPSALFTSVKSGNSLTLTYEGTGTPKIGELVFLCAPAQADSYFSEEEEEEVSTVGPVIWKFTSEADMTASNAAIYTHSVNGVAKPEESGYWSFDSEMNALHLDYSSHWIGDYRFMPKKSGGTFTTKHKYMRITYYVSGLDYDGHAYFKITNNGGSAAYAVMPDDLTANEGKWTVSQVIDLTENLNTSVAETDNNYSLPNRLNGGGHVTVSLIGGPQNAEVYIREIAFFDTFDGAYEYYKDTPVQYSKEYLDAELGKFTDFTVLDGDNLGEWTYDKVNAFTLTDSGNSNFGGNYRMAFKYNINHFVGNKYMRVVYKADNGSATGNVKLTVVNPKYSEIAVLDSDIKDTNGEWVLSGVAELPANICDRLGGTGEYDTGNYEKMFQQHVFMGFDNTASDARYGVKGIYFFKSLEDALAFMMPTDATVNTSTYTFGNTTYNTAEYTGIIDDTLASGTYRIYVENDTLYVTADSEGSLSVAKTVANSRVLGGDTYEDVVNITLASDFVLEGTANVSSITENVALKYDDRYTFDKEVAMLISHTVTSTDAVTGDKDKSILRRIDGETFAASGIGSAYVYFTDGTGVEVTVTAAPLNVIMLVGQSNTEGVSGSASLSIRNTPGQVYSTYACAGYRYINMVLGSAFTEGLDALTIYNNDVFIPESLTSDVSRTGNSLTYDLDELNEGGYGKGGIDAAIAYEWNRQTGEKVWIINAAHSGSGVASWLPGSGETDNNFWQAVGVMKSAEETLKAEIAAGHYTLNHMGYFWLQGCSDAGSAASVYKTRYEEMHSGFVSELAFDHDGDSSTAEKTVEFGGIILVRRGGDAHNNKPTDYYMNGPRLAQYLMGNTAGNGIYLAGNVGDYWRTDADVSSYFINKYETNANFRADNNVSYDMPATVNAVHPDIHYRQVGYNEIARDAVHNILRMEGIIEAEAADISFKLLDSQGVVTDFVTDGVTLASGASVMIVPDAAPRYFAGEVTVTTSANITHDGYYSFKSSDGGAGTITFTCGGTSVTVKVN